MAKIKTIPCDIYRWDIDVFLGSHEEFRNYVKTKLKDKNLLDIVDDGEPGIGDFYFNDGQMIIRLEKFPETPKDIGVAAHEALHATMYILNWANVKYEQNGSNESFTYLQEWILTNILNKKGYTKV